MYHADARVIAVLARPDQNEPVAQVDAGQRGIFEQYILPAGPAHLQLDARYARDGAWCGSYVDDCCAGERAWVD
jgi:hypothetical protein